MTSPSQPIRIKTNNDVQRATSSCSPEFLFSKSLGDYSRRGSRREERNINLVEQTYVSNSLWSCGTSLYSCLLCSPHTHQSFYRNISDISLITYAGYLLKRSNRSFEDFLVPPLFPLHHSDQQCDASCNGNVQRTLFNSGRDLGPDDVLHLHAPHHFAEQQVAPEHKVTQASNGSLAEQTADELGMRFLASFFGIELPASIKPHEVSVTTDERKEELKTTVQTSSPDELARNNRSLSTESKHDFSTTPYQATYHSGASKPADWIDPVNGHIWRAKYCILAGGALFFYSDKTVAESPEAAAERLQVQFESEAPILKEADLSQSPMPVPAEKQDLTSRIWEKRVALEYVGAVRSAEREYGPHSFELSAGDDDSDKLVLRARNGDEMNDWLFQFHRCIFSFVMDMVDHVVVPTFRAGDLHHPRSQQYSPHTSNSKSAFSSSCMENAYSPIRSGGRAMLTTASFSPRYNKMKASNGGRGAPLSHGHGRSCLRRRRPEQRDRTPSIGLSPELPLTVLSLYQPSTHLITPSVPPRYSPETAILTTNNSIFAMDSLPELCSPPSEDPETERPPPAHGKYVPPPLRSKGGSPKGKYLPPHMRKPQAKYVPPHLRNNDCHKHVVITQQDRCVPRLVRKQEPAEGGRSSPLCEARPSNSVLHAILIDSDENHKDFKLGGCADPAFVSGSIMDERFISREYSKLGKVRTTPFGYASSAQHPSDCRLRWEIGAFSECGIRDYNEDSYLVTSDLIQAFTASDEVLNRETVWDRFNNTHPPGLFAIFDGHCGDHASRFAAEQLTRFIYEESLVDERESENEAATSTDAVEDILARAMHKLDEAFCKFCVAEGREWEAGSTALVAALANEHLVIANLGDARGIMGRSVGGADEAARHQVHGWNELPFEDCGGDRRRWVWKEVTDVHSPNKEIERARIHEANGWVTTEQEIPVGQLKRMALHDDDVVDILKRCFADRYQQSPKASAPHRVLQISRVCGELSVSRALGDREFKATRCEASKIATTSDVYEWDSPHLGLIYPEGHSKWFVGDLISNKPDFQAIRVGEKGVSEEFLLLACDGLWDVIDADDAYRVTRDLLFEKQWSAKKTAARLAELAVHLGSSDNITVIIVRFFER